MDCRDERTAYECFSSRNKMRGDNFLGVSVSTDRAFFVIFLDVIHRDRIYL